MRELSRTDRPAVLATALLLVVGLLAATLSAAAPAGAASRWAPAGQAKITPGVQMFTKGAQCSANFVFTDRKGRVYLGYAAHCAGRGGATDTNGCTTRSRPIGTRVRFARGATAATGGDTVGWGRLAYSSWRAMRRAGAGPAACRANDFALVRVGKRHERKVNPSVPFWGGPTGLARRLPAPTREVYSYGRSSLRPTELLSAKTGAAVDRYNRGWSVDVYTATPGIPGDSGSGFLNQYGKATGVLSTLGLAPKPAANGVGNLRKELRYARRHTAIPGLRLVKGTRPFSPIL